MKLPRRQFLRLAALPAVSSFATSEGYPTRPLRLMVGFAAGGNFDVVARILAEWMSQQLHQPVIVETQRCLGRPREGWPR